MIIERYKIEDMTGEHWALWSNFRVLNDALYSPYFHPNYVKTIAEFHSDCYVAIIRDETKLIGFLPFQQKKLLGPANVIGAPLTDYHGIVSAQPLLIDMRNVLAQAKISFFRMPYHTNMPFNSKTCTTNCSVMSLDGFETADSWRENHSKSYKRFYKTLQRKSRKTEREMGSCEFIWQSQDRGYFDLLLNWKRRQFHRSAKYDVFGVDWTVEFLWALLSKGPKADLRADMHVMLIKGQPVAIELGLTDGVTYHNWILSYDEAYSKISPGAQLKEAIIDQALSIGYRGFDLGTGTDRHKAYYTTEEIQTGETLWLGHGIQSNLANLYFNFEMLGKSKLKDIPGKLRRRYGQISACDSSLSGQAVAMLGAIKTGGSKD